MESHLKKSAVVASLTALLFGLSPTLSHSNQSTVRPIQGPISTLEKTSKAFNDVALKATPAVVSINSVKYESASEAEGMSPFGLPDPDSDSGMGIGSGVIIREDGIILTNYHVVEDASKVTVSLDDDKSWNAKVVGSDPGTDIAVLKITDPVKNLPTIRFGNSDGVQVGDWAVAIGAPFGLKHSVTSGIISAKGRAQLGAFDTEDFIQTDAAINPGNSGGPLLNLQGEMIGLNAAIFSQSGGFIGIGFSIPSNLAQQIADEILKTGRVARGWIGVVAQDVDENVAKYFKIPASHGALVSDVVRNGPASSSKLTAGDIILKFNGAPIKNSSDLKGQVAKTKAGQKADVEVWRNGKSRHLNVTVKDHPDSRPKTQLAGRVARKNSPAYGLALRDIPSEYAQELGIKANDGALVIGVEPGSMAFDAGLSPGDVILKLNDYRIHNATEFLSRSKKAMKNDLAMLYVQRGPSERVFIPLKKEG